MYIIGQLSLDHSSGDLKKQSSSLKNVQRRCWKAYGELQNLKMSCTNKEHCSKGSYDHELTCKEIAFHNCEQEMIVSR